MMLRQFSKLVVCFVLSSVIGSCALILPSHHRTEDYTPLFAAASAGDFGEVRREIDTDPKLVRATEWDDATLLHDAVGQNHLEVSAYLLDKGAQIDAVTKDGLTPLHMAAQNGNIPIIKLLIVRGASINPVDENGWTPTDRALKWDHPDAAAFLKQNGGREGH